ncbi:MULTISPECIES: type 1 glutamine amidotransferase domain-containing protein [Saccharopolyspora]|uniref:type 1 glutamine amidotransferase domain-containing protein n=1 Tax=Saccharopolyspora TaxID=1835 RepID=UPI0014400DB2|nr:MULTISPECIES: type 1 glutamine amidotransferase domain-containing protein [Saccharopolyspora]QIZ38397.1 type 1 glutamine amidotransferase [Saccharopolyspora sp. ASAGF58]
MANELRGRRVAILAADGVEQVELEQPRQAVEQAGAEAELVSVHAGQIQAMNHDINPGDRFTVDREISEASADDYDALILPGGTINPDNLRRDARAVEFVRSFVNSGKPVGAICHGPWTLVEADVVRDRKLTSFHSIRTDIRNAGGEVVDEEVVVDHGLVTSRSPRDLPAFNNKIVETFAQGT